MHRFDVKTSKNVELRRKPFKTAKLQKWSTYTELHRFDVKTSKNVQLLAKHSKPLNSQSDQLILNCIDLTSKRSKMLRYVANHSKQRWTTKVIKIQWLASIWCQKWSNNDEFAPIWRQNELKCRRTSQNNRNIAKLQKWSTYTELHRFDVKTSKNVQLLAKHSKPLNSQSDQLILNCIDLTSKRSKMLSYVANHSKPLNYKSDQLILNCIDLTSKRAKMMSYVAKHSKLRKTTKVIKF